MNKGTITKKKIHDISRELFHRRGYNNTSISDILEFSGVKKGSLFYHYKSKMHLFIDVLKNALLNYETQINSGIHHTTACEKIDDIIVSITDFHINGDISKGCMFGNMALELGDDGSEISQFVGSVFKRWEKRFEDLLIEAEKNGELSLKEPARVLARMILSTIEGGVLLSKVSGSTEPLKDCTGFIRTVINERKIKRRKNKSVPGQSSAK